IDEAILNGASAIVVSKDIKEKKVPVIKVKDTNEELPKLCAKFYDYPNKFMKMIGVTGTDGKTTTSTIIQTLIGKQDCGYIGTNGRSCYKFDESISNTTPDAYKLYSYLQDFKEAGCKYVAMEASSEAFYRGRLEGLEYDISIFTNITNEHLNIHGTFDNYISCKKKLFEQTKPLGFCILNKDDSHFEEIKKACRGNVLTYGKKDADMTISSFKIMPYKTIIVFNYKNKDYEVESPLLGDFNVYNLAAALLACLSLGFKMESLLEKVKELNVDGRLMFLKTNTPYYVMVDYAHTPNGIIHLLNFVHTLDINRSIVVIGSAGERDFLKRPLMGKTVCDNASYAIFTYEDPRSEDPKDIADMLVSDIKSTYKNYEIILDRKEAIERAINIANPKDMVLILGKGNETYQKLKKETIYFNDVEEAYKAVKKRENTIVSHEKSV
ncbi:MAG: UDP-N-acetylmuramoyl-L-alanyl-D-glutamate--2,6-diaminopimelate ligase, partial [Bacilli bacterium]